MRRTVQVTANIYRVATDMRLSAGDQVMAVGDVLVGIYTGTDPTVVEASGIDTRPSPRERTAALLTAAGVEAKPKHTPAKGHAKGKSHRKKEGTPYRGFSTTHAEAAKLRASLLDWLQSQPVNERTTSEVITAYLNKPSALVDRPTKGRIYNALRRLVHDGLVVDTKPHDDSTVVYWKLRGIDAETANIGASSTDSAS